MASLGALQSLAAGSGAGLNMGSLAGDNIFIIYLFIVIYLIFRIVGIRKRCCEKLLIVAVTTSLLQAWRH